MKKQRGIPITHSSHFFSSLYSETIFSSLHYDLAVYIISRLPVNICMPWTCKCAFEPDGSAAEKSSSDDNSCQYSLRKLSDFIT